MSTDSRRYNSVRMPLSRSGSPWAVTHRSPMRGDTRVASSWGRQGPSVIRLARLSVARMEMKPSSGLNHDRRRRITSTLSSAARVRLRSPLRKRKRPTCRSKSCSAAKGARSSSSDAARSPRASPDSVPGLGGRRHGASVRPGSESLPLPPGRAAGARSAAPHRRFGAPLDRWWPDRNGRTSFPPTPSDGRARGRQDRPALRERERNRAVRRRLREGRAVAFDATRNGPTRTDHQHVVFPAIAKVV